MELGPEDVSLLERCPHFRGWYVQASMELGPEDVSLSERCPHFPQVFEDARDSPLEKRISDSIVATKDNKDNGIFSLVPSRVATFPSSNVQTDVISNPDCFSDFFRLLCE